MNDELDAATFGFAWLSTSVSIERPLDDFAASAGYSSWAALVDGLAGRQAVCGVLTSVMAGDPRSTHGIALLADAITELQARWPDLGVRSDEYAGTWTLRRD